MEPLRAVGGAPWMSFTCALAMSCAMVVFVACSGGACPEGLREVGGMCVPEDAGAGDACVPGAETCDNTDEDCDGAIDEEVTRACGTDRGACETGTETCSGGVWGRCVDPVDPTTEVCDGSLDDDCDGATDETPNFPSDPNNCGSCGTRCAEPNAVTRCQTGSCVRLACSPGFVDLDPRVAGCEYACDPRGAEVCNGVDDDCDVLIDEGFVKFCNRPGGVMTMSLCANPGETVCDGVDDNCDGRIDEGLLNACGACGPPPAPR